VLSKTGKWPGSGIFIATGLTVWLSSQIFTHGAKDTGSGPLLHFGRRNKEEIKFFELQLPLVWNVYEWQPIFKQIYCRIIYLA
jgi:hypothetical protein